MKTLSLSIIIGSICAYTYINKPRTSKFTICLKEDNSVNLTDYWKARIEIISGNDTININEVDKSNPMLIFDVKDSDIPRLKYNVALILGNFCADESSDTIVDGIHNITIPISHNSNRSFVTGIVAALYKPKAPINNALVIVDDQHAKTDYRGAFTVYVDSPLVDSTIHIFKKGYDPYVGKLRKKPYRLIMNGDFDFQKLAKDVISKIDSNPITATLAGAFYTFKNNDTISGKAHMFLALDNDSIYGYSYYDRIYELSSNKINSYFLINGKYNPDNRTFNMHLLDAVNNEIDYIGYFDGDSIWYAETFSRERDSSNTIGYFIFK